MTKTDKFIQTLLEQLENPGSALPDGPEAPIEQDATQPQSEQPEQPQRELTSEGEKFYIGLLIKAFAHTPDDNELQILDKLQRESSDTNPKAIANAIQKMLDGSNEEFKDLL